MPRWCLVLLLASLVAMATAGGQWRRGTHGRQRHRQPSVLSQSLSNYNERQNRKHDHPYGIFHGGAGSESSAERVPGEWNPFKHLESHFGNDLMNFMYDHHWGQQRPNQQKLWWQGPNICEKKTEEAMNETEEQDPVMYHFSFSTRQISCDESESAYKCIIEENDSGNKHKTTMIYECCHGFQREKRDFGCPNKMRIKNLVDTAKDLGLTEFLQAVDMLKLTDELKFGNYTVFAPVNGAFGLDGDLVGNARKTLILKDAPAAIEVSEPALEETLEALQGAILGHMLAGAHRSSSLNDEHVVSTGHPESSTIRINYFSRPAKLMTANCVPVVSRDHIATNGVIHTVERALKPVTESLLDLVRTRPDLTMLKTVLAAAAYVPKLEEDGQFTLLAPTNDAFNKMNPRLRERLLNGDKNCIANVLFNHILPHVICSSAFQEKSHTLNLLKKQVSVTRTEGGKLFANDAQVVERDIMGLNGVMHIIDDVLIPEEALGLLDVMERQGFTELISLVETAGLTETLNSAKNVTLFAPTNEAIMNLPLALKSKLSSDRDLLKKVLTYHVSPTKVNTEHFRNEKLVSTLEGRQVRLNRYTNNPFFEGVRTAQCSVIQGKPIKTCNGQLNSLSQVMIPPIGSVVDVLASDKRFSVLVSLVKKADLAHALQNDGPFTVFAPNNKAFKRLDNRTLDNLLRQPKKLAALLKSHVYTKNLCCAGILRESWFSGQNIRTLSGTYRRITKNRYGEPSVSHVPIVKCDRTASNGNVLEIEQVLPTVSHSWRRRWNRRFNRNNWDNWFWRA